MRESLDLLIGSAGWRAETFESGHDFLSRPRVSVPCCLLLDVTLPALNGLELQRQLAERTDMPIIFITRRGEVAMSVASRQNSTKDAPTRAGSTKDHMHLQHTVWPADELRKIAATDDLHISPFREDGVTRGTPTWIWSVVVDDGLYVRGYNGQESRWYQAAIHRNAGRIRAAGITKDVVFEPVHGAINDRIDKAYRTNDAGSPCLNPMIGARARAATVRVMPRG